MQLDELMSHEGTVYRRVRTLTRKVLDVLLLLLRRDGYASDLPGLFQRLPGEEVLKLEYHEAEAGVKALRRRGFLAEVSDKRMASNGRVVFAVPEELGEMLTSLFREETRTVASVFGLEDHAAAHHRGRAGAAARVVPGARRRRLPRPDVRVDARRRGRTAAPRRGSATTCARSCSTPSSATAA